MFKILRQAVDRRRHADSQYGWLFQPYTGDELVAVAYHATVPEGAHAEPIAIAAVKLRDDRVLISESLDLLVQHPSGLPGEAMRGYGLRGIDLEEGDPVDAALERLLNFIGNRPLIMWSQACDVARLNHWLRPRFGFSLPNATLDVSNLYQRRQPYRHPQLERWPHFTEAAERLGVPDLGGHSALDDAVTIALIYRRLMRGDTSRPRTGLAGHFARLARGW